MHLSCHPTVGPDLPSSHLSVPQPVGDDTACLVTFLAAQHLSRLPGFGEIATVLVLRGPASLCRGQKTQTGVLPTPVVLPACQMTPSGTQVWVGDGEKQKSFRFHFTTKAVGVWDLECWVAVAQG